MIEKILKIYNEMNNLEAIQTYGHLVSELKTRKIIKTNNVIGDLGEGFVISYYNGNSELPNLQEMPIGTKYFDARSLDGKRYTIKTVTTNTTGVFNGLNEPNDERPEKQLFDSVIIVVLHPSNLLPQVIYEVSWDNFLVHKRWNSSKNTWSLSLTKRLKEDAEIRYELSI